MFKSYTRDICFLFAREKESKCFFTRHLPMVLAAALFFVLLPGCHSGNAVPREEKSYSSRYVIDGDTIELSNGQKVRYIGIDTPETRMKEGREWVLRPERFGIEAKNRNSRLVEGKSLKLEFDVEEEDKYGRKLAYVYANGVMVNSLLLKEGLATVYTFPPNVKHYKEMIGYQREAFEAKKGIWGTLKNIKASEVNGYEGMFCLVSGKVQGHEISFGKIYLYLETDVPDRLYLLIYPRNLSLFELEGIDPLTYYHGKNIEVFGKISRQGSSFEMMIDNPFQIKVLDQDTKHSPGQ